MNSSEPLTEYNGSKVIKHFEFDIEGYTSFKYKYDINEFCFMLLPSLCMYLPLCPTTFCCNELNHHDYIAASRLFVTEESIVHIIDGHNTYCRCECTYIGKYEKIIPIERIQDVIVTEPGGNDCCVKQVLYTVAVQTAASTWCELYLTGLKDPYGFRDLIMNMKLNKNKPINKNLGEEKTSTPVFGEIDNNSSSINKNVQIQLNQLTTIFKDINETLHKIEENQKMH